MTIGEIVRRRLSGEHSSTDQPASGGAAGSSKRSVFTAAVFTRTGPKRAAPLRATAPRVSLLPPEFQAANRGTVIRRRLVIGVVGTAVIVAVAVGGAAFAAMSQAAAVTSATAANAALSAQLGRYAEVQKLERTAQLATAAARVGSSTAIDWQSVLASLQTGMPAGFSTTSIAIDSASPIADYSQGSTPLDSARVATVTLTAKAGSIAGLPAWLAAMQRVKGVADAPTFNVTADSSTGFTVAVTVHMTDAAYITPLGK